MAEMWVRHLRRGRLAGLVSRGDETERSSGLYVFGFLQVAQKIFAVAVCRTGMETIMKIE